MTGARDSSLRDLSDCGCCSGTGVRTPREVANRPGLSAVAYRVGTHSDFKQTLLARLPARPALAGLTTRSDDDLTIALLDAWATVCDVLTFYTERYANEAYLPTATERRSLVEMARLIGYRPAPGVAASAFLAFALDPQAGALGPALNPLLAGTGAETPPGTVALPVGTRVQSIPGPGEDAQTFETIERIEARAEWNAMRPRRTQPQALSPDAEFVILKGTATNLRRGDFVVIAVEGQSPAVRRVLRVQPDDDRKVTRVDFTEQPAPLPPYQPPRDLGRGVFQQFEPKTTLSAAVMKAVATQSWKAADLKALAQAQAWPNHEIAGSVAQLVASGPVSEGTGVFALRERAAIFGHNAPVWGSLPSNMRFRERVAIYGHDGSFQEFAVSEPAFPDSWEQRTLEADSATSAQGERTIDLDNVYAEIAAGDWLVLTAPGPAAPLALKVTGNSALARSDYSISGRISRVRVARSQPFPDDFKVRNAIVYGRSERLELADLPLDDPVAGDTVTLDRVYLGLERGRRVILSGERTEADLPGVFASEVMTLQEVSIEGGFTVLTFTEELANAYVRDEATINANVAGATHGETVEEEVIGGGDAGRPFHRLELKQKPLTYVSAGTAAGAESTLEVRVDDLLWREVVSFFGHGPNERIYVTHTDDDRTTRVVFGDGRTGARPPTGQTNVRARYRKGTGAGGNVGAGQLAQLLTRPLGVSGVTNPLAASGGADRESADDLRRNAPASVLVLDRIVSLRDYEDFARSFAGIEKALATWTWVGARRGVFVTVAGAGGAEVPEKSALRANLLAAMRDAGNPTVPAEVASYVPRYFLIGARVKVAEGHLASEVLAAAEAELRGAFGFAAREFGQPVSKGEVIARLQRVDGVAAVDLDALHTLDGPAGLEGRLVAGVPRPGADVAVPAEMLILDPRPVELRAMS